MERRSFLGALAAGSLAVALNGAVSLIEYEKLGPEALLSIPTPDHYLPMLYVIATKQQGEIITFPIQGVDGGSISMLTVQVG
jgi:4,5-DOPA dioxygenase extradiol